MVGIKKMAEILDKLVNSRKIEIYQVNFKLLGTSILILILKYRYALHVNYHSFIDKSIKLKDCISRHMS